MKSILTATIAILAIATSAAADGPTPVRVDPPVIVPPGGELSPWDGGFLRLSFGKQARTVERETLTTSETIPEIQTPETADCPYTTGHSGGAKCDLDADQLTQAFGEIGSCNRRYVETCIVSINAKAGTVRVWVPGAQIGDAYTYETGNIITTYGEPITTTVSSFMSDSFDENTTGLSAGYRHDFGTLVLGAEAGARRGMDTDDTMTFGELQAGIDLGRALPYLAIGYATDDDASGMIISAGADLALNQQWMAGVKAYKTDYDVTGFEASIAMRF